MEYQLDIYEALRVVMEGGAVKGNGFKPGIFMRLNHANELVIVDANSMYQECTYVHLHGMKHQKFRVLTVFTLKQLQD